MRYTNIENQFIWRGGLLSGGTKILNNMKARNMSLDDIRGLELTQKDKALYKGGDVGPDCPVMCQLWDIEGDLGPPACCPWPDPFTCMVEIESYYRSLTPPTYLYASCWEVNGGEQ